MSEELLNFSEVMEKTKDMKRVLLLGNGFSMAYNKDRFSYTSLLQRAVYDKIIQENSPIHKLFNEFSTKDFEEIIKKLEDSAKVLNFYDSKNSKTTAKLKQESSDLKKYLVDVVTNNHPEKSTSISDMEYKFCIDFIKRFDSIYTLNYDLLLYWTTMHFKEWMNNYDSDEEKRLEISDGFSGEDDLIFNNAGGNKFDIHYLHGALHYYDGGDEIQKLKYSPLEGTLKEQILVKLNNNKYPIFISEGTSKQKKAKIIHNAYLNHCFKSFQSTLTKNKALIVFGTGLKKNDDHIVDVIVRSACNTIYIGIRSATQIENYAELRSKIEHKNSKNIFFYDFNTANIWDGK